ncbi:MAG: ABC transporter permease subunit [Firmicutes bacterium]|nr:ABC transporter permease subunit [Bacillota bacterium]
MFGRLYVSELGKLFRPKTAIVIGIILILLFTLMTLIFEVIPALSASDNADDLGLNIEDAVVFRVTKEEIDSLILDAQLSLKAKEESVKNGNSYFFYAGNDMIYSAKSELAIYQYIKANELYDTDLRIYGGAGASTIFAMFSGSASDYIPAMTAVLAGVLVVYALIIGSGAFASELKSGTLKLVLLRPILREKLALAKLLAVLTIVTVAFTLAFLLTIIFAYARHGTDNYLHVFVFNARTPFAVRGGYVAFHTFMVNWVELMAYSIFAFSIGTLTKNRVMGIALPLGASMLSFIAQIACLGRFWPTNVIVFDAYFSSSALSGALGGGMLATVLFGGSNFWIAISMFVIYIGGLLASAFLVFKKRDVA